MQYSITMRADKKKSPKPYSPLMVSAATPRDGSPAAHFSSFLREVSTGVSSFLALKPLSPPLLSLKLRHPLPTDSSFQLASPTGSAQPDSPTPNPSACCCPPPSEPGLTFPSGSRISTAKGGGPAFVGHIYGIYDESGDDLVDASSHFQIPFPFKRSPEWLKRMVVGVTKSDKNGTGSRFFIDENEADSYLQDHYIPNGFVDGYDLDSAYESFKAKPHAVQFVQSKRQVKEAEKLLKNGAWGYGKRKPEDGVPIFSSQNLDVVIETRDGIKRYTPYFFDKKLLDDILEDSIDQHFQLIIANRDAQRWAGGAGGDVHHNRNNGVFKEMGRIMWDVPEVQEVHDEVSDEEVRVANIPLRLLPKVAGTEILYAVDRLLLGNRWLRKATGIQPKFPYVVDSFERKTSSFLRASRPPVEISDSEFENAQEKQAQVTGFQFPFGDWLAHPWLNNRQKQQSLLDTSDGNYAEPHRRKEVARQSSLIPKVSILNIATEEPPLISEDSSQKATHHLVEELDEEALLGPSWTKSTVDERDPLFVADFEALSVWYSNPRVG